MKKILMIMIIASSLLLSACGNEIKKENVNTNTSNTTSPQKENNNNEESSQESSPEISRKNPAHFGELINAQADYIGIPIEYEIELSNLVRGDEAFQRALQMNQFNEIKEDEEIIFFDVSYKLLKFNPVEDDPVLVSRFDFEYYKDDFAQFRSDSSIVVEGELYGKVYENGEITGLVGMVIPKGNNGYLVFNDQVWFTLNQ